MDEELSSLSYKGAEVYGIKNEILMIQVIDPSDLKCVKEEVNIAEAQNWM